MSLEGKITKAKLDQAINMLRNKSPEELSQKFNDKSRKDLLSKLDEIDSKKLAEMNIDPQAIMSQLTPGDLDKIRKVAGKDADVLMEKIKGMLSGRR